MRNAVIKLVLAASLIACGGSAPPAAESAASQAGASEAAPTMECLPVRLQSRSEQMDFAWLLAEQSFEDAAPAPPPRGSDTQTIQAWTGGPLREWLDRKNRLVEAARAELNAVAEESHAQRIMAGGLVGLMYESVARVLVDVPTPSDLRSEPEIEVVFQEVIEAQARPYLEHAHRAYNACAQNAGRDDDHRHWAHWCAERESLLPLTHEEATAEGTTVEVIPPS